MINDIVRKLIPTQLIRKQFIIKSQVCNRPELQTIPHLNIRSKSLRRIFFKWGLSSYCIQSWDYTLGKIDMLLNIGNKFRWTGKERDTWGSVTFLWKNGDAVWKTPSQPCMISSKHPGFKRSAENSFRWSLALGNCSRCFAFSAHGRSHPHYHYYPFLLKTIIWLTEFLVISSSMKTTPKP